MFCLIRLIRLILHHQIFIYLDLFFLFRSLQNSLIGKNFTSLEDCKKHLEEFVAYKTGKFWEDEIFKLQRWRKVVEKNGEYIIE